MSGAIFLSYAREDAHAARRIAEVLRSEGVDVWFDQNELRGGGSRHDAIRDRIRSCTLFIPIISAHTQGRLEGHFRREWTLAIDRTSELAQEKAFLVPVAIDETAKTARGVPEEFRTIHWTHLPPNAEPGAFIQRVKGLLADALAAGQSAPPPAAGSYPGAPSAPSLSRPKAGNWRWLGWAGIATAVVIAVLLGARFLPGFSPDRALKSARAATRAPTRAVAGEDFPSDPDLKRAWDLIFGYRFDSERRRTEIDSGREDFGQSEEIIRGLLARRPNDPEATIVYAQLNTWFINRGFDSSEARYALAGKYCHRAMQLAPENPESLAAMAEYLTIRLNDHADALRLIRQAIALNPAEPRYYRVLYYNVLHGNEQLKAADQAAQRFPRDYLTWYDLGQIYLGHGMLPESEQSLDHAIAIDPDRGAGIVWKAFLAYANHGDPVAMKKWLDRLSGPSGLTDRFAYQSYLYAALTGETKAALTILAANPHAWFRDFCYTGPRQLLVGDLLHLQGKDELARLQYTGALAQCQLILSRNSADQAALAAESWCLLGLGKLDQARAACQLLFPQLPRPHGILYWWHDAVPLFALAGESDDALVLFKEAVQRRSPAAAMMGFKTDPRLLAWRKDPKVHALLGPIPPGKP